MISKSKLKNLIDELKNYRANATVLLSLYIPPEYPISKVMQQLVEEYGTADNIKTKKTRQDVKSAISRAMEALKNYRKTPENGLVIFSGNVSNDPGKDDVRIWVIEPPEPVTVRIYRTEKYFITGPLEEILENRDVYGIVIVEKDQATIGLLSGKRLILLEELTAQVPGKTRAGGQSARRYERLREQAVHEFFKRLGEHLKDAFLPYIEKNRLKGIIIGGPAYAKEDFLAGDYIDYRLRDRIIGLVDTSYQGEYGLREVLERSESILKEHEYIIERRLVEDFIRRVVTGDNKVAYGRNEIERAIEWGAIDVLLISEDNPEIERFKVLGNEYGFDVFVVSKETEEGQRFKSFGGLGAILRFPISGQN